MVRTIADMKKATQSGSSRMFPNQFFAADHRLKTKRFSSSSMTMLKNSGRIKPAEAPARLPPKPSSPSL